MALEFPSKMQHYNFIQGGPVNKHGFFGGANAGRRKKKKKLHEVCKKIVCCSFCFISHNIHDSCSIVGCFYTVKNIISKSKTLEIEM
jgi:hypothetical protein